MLWLYRLFLQNVSLKFHTYSALVSENILSIYWYLNSDHHKYINGPSYCWPSGSRGTSEVLLTSLCFSCSSADFRTWGGWLYHYKGQASGQLTQQETLTHLATRVHTRNWLASLRAAAHAQLMQNILTWTDRRIFFKSLLEVESFHKASESSRTISQTVRFDLLLRKIHVLAALQISFKGMWRTFQEKEWCADPHLKGGHTHVYDPHPTFTESWFNLITLIDGWFGASPNLHRN